MASQGSSRIRPTHADSLPFEIWLLIASHCSQAHLKSWLSVAPHSGASVMHDVAFELLFTTLTYNVTLENADRAASWMERAAAAPARCHIIRRIEINWHADRVLYDCPHKPRCLEICYRPSAELVVRLSLSTLFALGNHPCLAYEGLGVESLIGQAEKLQAFCWRSNVYPSGIPLVGSVLSRLEKHSSTLTELCVQ